MGKCFQIGASRGCFQELLPLLATCSATYAAAQIHALGTFQTAPDHAFVIVCKHLNARVVLPLHGPIQDVLFNQLPEGLAVGVLPGRGSPPVHAFESLGSKDLFNQMIHPYIVNQFERGKSSVDRMFKGGRNKWPPAWQMGWLIRNGLSHGGTVHFDLKRNRSPYPVRWHDLTIGVKQQGDQILGNFVNVGDLIVLSLEMEEALAGPLPFVAMEDNPRNL